MSGRKRYFTIVKKKLFGFFRVKKTYKKHFWSYKLYVPHGLFFSEKLGNLSWEFFRWKLDRKFPFFTKKIYFAKLQKCAINLFSSWTERGRIPMVAQYRPMRCWLTLKRNLPFCRRCQKVRRNVTGETLKRDYKNMSRNLFILYRYSIRNWRGVWQ